MFANGVYDGKIVHKNIIEATEEFNAKYCIRMGGCGTVQKAELSTGQIVAVKLHANVNDGLSTFEAFTSEIRTLSQIRHSNIDKLYGFYLCP